MDSGTLQAPKGKVRLKVSFTLEYQLLGEMNCSKENHLNHNQFQIITIFRVVSEIAGKKEIRILGVVRNQFSF